MKQTLKMLVLLVLLAGIAGKAHANGTPPACDKVGYDKGFYLKTCDGEFKLKFNVHLQPQYQFLSIEGGEDTNTFQIRRARLIFSGNAFTEDLTYKFQYEAIGGRDNAVKDNDAFVNSLRDAYLNYKYNEQLNIMVGQAKPLFNREELTSDTEQQFIGYTIANEVFTHERDMGVWIHGKAFEKKLEYGVFMTNEGLNRNKTNQNNDFLFGGRVVYNILGNHGYTFGAVKHPEDHQLAVGAAVDYNAADSNGGGDKIIATTGDIAYMYKNFSAFGAGYFARDTDADATLLGFSGQAGYFIIPEKFEVVGRFAGVIPKATGVTNGYEAGGAVNYYFRGHNLKLTADYGMLINSALVHNGTNQAKSMFTSFNPGFHQDQTDHRVRAQLQLFF
ncbi:OprO/OprP family phosphate-selective porin [bacterium]|nr:OprO/OprP family phosphate-selective porin [bacterium]